MGCNITMEMAKKFLILKTIIKLMESSKSLHTKTAHVTLLIALPCEGGKGRKMREISGLSKMLEPGYYLNMFEVILLSDEAEFMTIERSQYPSLEELRKEVEFVNKKVYLYAPVKSSKVFGYGKDMDWLSSKGFEKEIVKFVKEPRLTGRLILDGVIEKANKYGYHPIEEREKGRPILFNKNEYEETSDGNVRVYRSYDIRVVFLKDVTSNKLKFYLIVDLRHLLRDKNSGKPLNFREIVCQYGSETLKEIRVIQKDLIRIGERQFKANLEASRQRLLEDIVPFVRKIGRFNLPCGTEAVIDETPCRVVVVI